MPSDVVEQYKIPVLDVIHKYCDTKDMENIFNKSRSELGLIQDEVSECVKLLLENELLTIEPGNVYRITGKGLSELEKYNNSLYNL